MKLPNCGWAWCDRWFAGAINFEFWVYRQLHVEFTSTLMVVLIYVNVIYISEELDGL